MQVRLDKIEQIFCINSGDFIPKSRNYECINGGAVALANIFCWAVALLYAKMGAKSVVISPPSLINTGSFPDIPFGMPDFKLFCFQPLKSMLSLMKKDDSPFFRSESCNEAY